MSAKTRNSAIVLCCNTLAQVTLRNLEARSPLLHQRQPQSVTLPARAYLQRC